MTVSAHFMTQRTKSSPFRSRRAGPLSNVDITGNLLELYPFYGGTLEFQQCKLQHRDCQTEGRFVPHIVFFFYQHLYLIVPCSAFEVFEVRFAISGLFIADASEVRLARVSDPPSGPIQCHKEAETPIEH
jgi:hypothetical protein